MVLPGLPPLVREGDRFRAGFTLRNTTNRSMDVDVSAKAEGISAPLDPQTVSLIPGEAKEIGWDVTASIGVETLKWEVEIKERGTHEADRIKITQKSEAGRPCKHLPGHFDSAGEGISSLCGAAQGCCPGQGRHQGQFPSQNRDGLSGVIDLYEKIPLYLHGTDDLRGRCTTG